MSEARSRAKSARKKRSGGAAQAHNLEVAAHEKVMKELDKRAAKIIFAEKNKVSSGYMPKISQRFSQRFFVLES
jgi:hypothetical protein